MQRSMLITAGPTHEPIDEVRYIANRSSGKMGIAIAQAAYDAGWQVTLLLGPVGAVTPTDIQTLTFRSTLDLQNLLDRHFPEHDVLVMAAAVADYRPTKAAAGKLERRLDRLTLELEATPDLTARCAERRRPGQMIVGFALEEAEKLELRAREKLARKQIEAIVANPLQTMGSDDVFAIVFTAEGGAFSPAGNGPLDKAAFGRWLVKWIQERLLGME